MNNKIKILMLCIIFAGLTLGVGCKEKSINKVQIQTVAPEQTQQTVELNVWNYSTGLENAARLFESNHKNVKVNIKVYSYEESNEAYMSALAGGNGPDVLVIDSGFFGQYTVNGLLQDLLQEPFLAGKYEKDFIGWESNLSIDNKELLALTLFTAPQVTYYREDVMKEYGFPSEPEEFGKFIEKPENLFNIARKLKEDRKFIFQWSSDIPNLYGSSMGIFDSNLNFMRYGNFLSTGVDLAKQARNEGLESQVSFWDESGKKAIRDNKMVMLSGLGSWATDMFKRDFPEQKGKWRITKPMLGIKAWASDSKIAINAQSTHKELAWEFVKMAVTNEDKGALHNMVFGYKPAWNNPQSLNKKNEFLGGQEEYSLLQSLAEEMIQYKLTPLDKQAIDIYNKGMNEAIIKSSDSYTAVTNLAKKVEESLEEDRKTLSGR